MKTRHHRINDAIATRDVGLSGIAVTPNRMRSLRTDVVKELAASIKEVGLLNPITVRASEGIGYYLVAGRHRLEAVKVLGLPSILCRILPADTDDNTARLAEIDENLQRAELSPAETALHHAERKRLYEVIHGKAKAIGAKASNKAQGKGDATAKLATASFTKDTAEKTGKSERTVRRDNQRGETLGADTLGKVIGTSLDKGDELDALGKLDRPARDALVEEAAKGEKVSAKAEVKKKKPDLPTSPDHPPTGNSADPAEAANLAKGLITALTGMAPIVDRIFEIGKSEFWKQITSKQTRKELGLLLDDLWRLQGIHDFADLADAERYGELGANAQVLENAGPSAAITNIKAEPTGTTAEPVQHEDPGLPEFLDRRHEAPPVRGAL